MKEGFSYDDILLVPQRSPVKSRKNVDLSTELPGGIILEKPFITAPMDTVTEKEMASEMASIGGMGFIHRFMNIEQQAEHISEVEGHVGGTVGINEDYIEHSSILYENGASLVCLDIAHGHMEASLDAVESIKEEFPDKVLCAGNVATTQGAYDLIEAGADIVKVGIGSGSHCLTREVAGVGVPQFTAIRQAVEGIEKSIRDGLVSEDEVSIIADGGLQDSGDIVKALMAGADAVMAGGMFSGCSETPAPTVKIEGDKYKQTRGMASREARENRTQDRSEKESAVEGAECITEFIGPVEQKIAKLSKGVRSGLSYCGGHTIEKARENAEFIRVTASTVNRNGVHGNAFDRESL